eukprot:403358505
MEKLKSQPQRRISTAQNIQDENKDSLSNANKESEQLLKNSQMQKLTIADDQSSQQLMVYQQRSLAQIFDEADLKWDPDEQILWDKVQRLEELIDNLQLKENDIPELFEFTYSDEPMRKYFAVDCFSKILDSIFEKKQDHFELSEEICEKLSGILVQTIEIEQNILLVVVSVHQAQSRDLVIKAGAVHMGAIETLLNNLCYENLSKIFEIDILDLVNYYKNIDINKVIWFTLRSITKNSEYCVERFLQSRALDRMLITFEYDKFTNIHLAVSALEPIMDRILFQEAQQIIEKGILKGLIEVLLCPKEMEGQIGTHCIFKLLELTRDHYNKTEQSEKFVDILDEYGLPEYFLQCKQAYSPGSGLRQIDYVLKEFCGQQNNEYEEWKNHQFRDNKQHDFNYQIFEF